ncbi:DUF2141 domain-containing protein [Sphingomonas flavalba]|uniref:DUF2141 domain-containing protein n=1 Tax=Sphingomonas flavalba TaxID=2559804 RepID=UPI00109DE970|nr:DUF2141 domain-containing protein [Sphingomonas flavalba]
MSKFAFIAVTAVTAMVAPLAEAHAAPSGPDAAICSRGGEPAVLVRVDGFKAHTGTLRVQIYGDKPEDFLAKGRWLKRIEVPVPVRAGPMEVCVGLPRPGAYAVAVRHDVNGNGKSGDRSDGGGFSRNPGLSLLSLKPNYRDVVITVGGQPKPVDVVLNYVRGLSIGPIREAR